MLNLIILLTVFLGKGMDLVAQLIQQGRDHGLPAYIQWRKFCGLGHVRTFRAVSYTHLDVYKRQLLCRRWSRNIYLLLRPGGQTFLMFFTHASFLDMRIEVAFSEKWISYTKVIINLY